MSWLHDLFPDVGASDPLQAEHGAFAEVMYHTNADNPVCRELASEALIEVLTCDDQSRDARLGALLMGCVKIANPEMVAGFVDAISEFEGKDLINDKPTVGTPGETVIGCAGSGKKGKKTFNISTASMIVASAAGAKALKAGSRSASSLTGSSDILESVGFVIPESEAASTSLLDQTNFGFYSIEHSIPRFDQVYGGRFFAPHTLSYALPAVLIPVRTDKLLYGYAGPKVSLSARSLIELGNKSVMVCSNTADGVHYIDEMATVGSNLLSGAKDGIVGRDVRFDAVDYLKLGQTYTSPGIETCSTVGEQSDFFRSVLDGRMAGSIAESTVCLNAATMLYLADKCDHPRDGFDAALDVVRTGRATDKLQQIIEASRSIHA